MLKPAPEMPGLNGKWLCICPYNDAHMDQTYYLSADGQPHVFKGDIYDINKSPFQANLDKIKLDQQPSFQARPLRLR